MIGKVGTIPSILLSIALPLVTVIRPLKTMKIRLFSGAVSILVGMPASMKSSSATTKIRTIVIQI